MRKAYITIIVLVILGVAGYLIFHKSNNSSNNTSTPASSSTSNSSSSSSSSSQTATTSDWKVSIKDFSFTPSTLIVKKGTKVTWTNDDSTAHTVTGDNGGPSSGSLDPGKSYSFTFNTVGSFNYHCNFHSSMFGSVTVQ